MKHKFEETMPLLSPGQREAARKILYMLLLAAAYFMGAQFGLCLAQANQQVSVFWPSSGIAQAVLLLLGYRLWPGVFLGAFVSELSLHEPVWTSLGIAAGNTLEALAGVWLLRRYACREQCLQSLKGVSGLLLLSSFISTLISASNGAMFLCLSGLQPWAAYGHLFLTWWLGNAGGVLIVMPVILSWGRGSYIIPATRRMCQAIALWLTAVVLGILIFFHPLAMGDIWVYPYMAFPIVTLAALIFGERTVALMIFAICGITLWAAAHHIGIFMPVIGPLVNMPFGRSLIVVQIYTMAVAMVGLVVQASISERRLVEEQLHKSRTYLQKVIDHIPDPILIKDKHHILHGGNNALWAILNRPPETLIGKDCDEVFFRKEEADSFNARYDEVFRTGKTCIGDEIYTDSEGQQHIMSVKIALIQNGFEPSLVAIAHDITDLKKTEDRLRQYTKELENSNRELDDFAYIASHDLKEPLRGMQSFSQFVLEDYSDKLDDEGKRKLRAISDLTKRLDNLLNVLLQYSRLGRTALAIGNVNIGDIVRNSVGLVDISLKEKNTTVEIAQNWPVINCDRVRIGEVFQNLIGNALKYADKPENRIEIGWTTDHPRAPGEYAFYVRDHGIGIPEKFLDSIFKIFKRLHAKDAYGGGTGSGLAIVKKIIQQHGGQVWAESKGEGQGTTFYFTLPQKKG